MIKYGYAVIYATSYIQWSVVLRSTEPEYLALTHATRSFQWLRTVIFQLKIKHHSANVYQDLAGSMQWAYGSPSKLSYVVSTLR